MKGARPSTPGRLNPAVLRLAGVHVAVDGFSNIYAPLLPLLVTRHGLSLAAAGTLAMLFQIAASFSQLGFGHLADRWRPRPLLLFGPVVAVTLLGLIGLAGSRATLGLLLVVGGLGCAAFHPPAAVAVHRLGGDRPGYAMSVYITGGTLGFSFGPLLFAPVAQSLGLAWTALLVIPALVVLAVNLKGLPSIEVDRPQPNGGWRALRPYARPLTLLYLIVAIRTFVGLSFTTFLPVMLTGRGLSVGAAGSAFALYLFAAGVGGLAGGPAADRFGSRRVILVSLLASAPLLAVAPALEGWPFLLALSAGGFFLVSTLPVNVTFGQMLAPVSAGTVSSLMMGFAWGSGGLAVPLVGVLADRLGLETALGMAGLAPLLAAVCAWPLPRGEQAHAPRAPVEAGLPEPMRAGDDVVR